MAPKLKLPSFPLASLSRGMFFHHYSLLWDLTKRDFLSRYKGSWLGLVWLVLNPLLMLLIYSFVFSVAFKAKWDAPGESAVGFAGILFCGMIVHGLFAECLNRAPVSIIASPNYVKKVVFPLEVLPIVCLLSSILNFLVGFSVLAVFSVIAGLSPTKSWLLVPIVLFPLVVFLAGASWLLAALGVYLRDLSQITGFVATIALFLAPVFYPLSALPTAYQSMLFWNPITLPISQLRDVLLWDNPLHWTRWFYSFVISLVWFGLGSWCFQRLRKGFADVI